MKYVVFELNSEEIKREVFVLFPDLVTHIHMATVCKLAIEECTQTTAKAISAGFYNLNEFAEEPIECYGKSESLGLESRGQEDSDLINGFEYTHGIIGGL
jgi:hypothetical protein